MRSLWLVILSCVATPAYSQRASASKYRGTAKEQAAQLVIDAPGAVIMEDDMLVGHSGDRLDSAIGSHTYLVSAPGYVPRLVYTNQAKGVPTLNRTVSLAPVPTKGYEVELDYRQAKSFPATQRFDSLPSLCQAFAAAGLSFPAGLAAPCPRQTIIDDLQVVGAQTVFPDTAPVNPAGKSLLARLDHAADDDFYWSAEELFSAQPLGIVPANLVAYSAMRRQNCARVMEITMESNAAKVNNPGLTMLRGFCLELAGKADKAAAIYQTVLKAQTKPGLDLYYLSARGSQSTNADLAAKTLLACIDKLPAAYECYAALAQVRALSGQPQHALQALYAYHKAAGLAIRAAFGPPPLKPNPQTVASEAQLRPFNFELAAAAIALGVGTSALLPQATLISDLPSLKALLPLLDKSKDVDLTLNAYQAVARGYPKEPLHWVKLSELYRRANRCDDAVGAVNSALALVTDADRRAALTVTRASCLSRLGRYTEAKKDLTEVLASGHDTWQAHYNLGVVQERLGAANEAVEEYNRALQGNVPDVVRAQIEQRLNFQAKTAH